MSAIRALCTLRTTPETKQLALEMLRALPEEQAEAIFSLLRHLGEAGWYEAGGEPPRITIQTDEAGVKFLLHWLIDHGAGYLGGS